MPVVIIEMWEGRTEEEKEKLMKTVINARALKMLRYGVGALPVIKDDNTLVGILTMRDIEFAGPEIMNLSVSELMTKDNLITIT